jgi:Transposase DDE domain group 1
VSLLRRITVWVKQRSLISSVQIVADGDGLVSRAGTGVLVGLADRVGLTGALSQALCDVRERRGRHDPGRVVRDLAVMLADGGDCLADLGVLRDQQVLFGRVCSDATAWRLVATLTEERLDAIRHARASARARAWRAGARPQRITLDIDATLVASHSDKEGAAGTYKGGYGFHPLLCYLDETSEALAGLLRPGNAGANTASDHVEVLSRAVEQLPDQRPDEVVVRCDSGGATHDFLDVVVEMGMCFSVGYDLTQPVRAAILRMPESAWIPAVQTSGEPRPGAWVCELDLDLAAAGWPGGTRAICRRERPHPGAQLSFTDHDGYRFQVFITNQSDTDIAMLELRHRHRARVEDQIRNAKQTGLRNLPFADLDMNTAWLELVLTAQDLIAWTQTLLLDGDLARCEPKRLRYRLFHVAARITRTGRRVILHLPRAWPWRHALRGAFARLRALPAA